MIQELLGGAGLLGSGERKLSINGAVFETSPSPSLSSSPSSTTTVTATTATPTTATAATSTSENQNLRCPRCDSSNTKFCYYNNYNLTQPRHFCKTCRRYWTKGGALRNVPIGGGCRKNKSATVVTSIGKSSTGKLKTATSEIERSGLIINGSGFEHDLWAAPQNSHILALLRATQNPNSNPNPNPISNNSMAVKEEEMMNIGSHMMSEPVVSTGALNLRTQLGLDPSLGLCSSFWKNNLHQATQNLHHHQQNGITLGEVQNSGMQELYQRLRSSTTSKYYSNHPQAVLGNVGSSSSSSYSSTILESAAVGGGDLSYWHPGFSWYDHLPTTNGAYP